MRKPYPSHSKYAEGIPNQGVGRLGGESTTMGALANPVPGVTLAAFPVDIMQTAPDNRFAGGSFDPDEFNDLTQDETGHYMARSDLHCFGCELIPVLGPSHPLVQFVPGLSDRSRRNCPVADLLGPEEKAWRADGHWKIDQDRV